MNTYVDEIGNEVKAKNFSEAAMKLYPQTHYVGWEYEKLAKGEERDPNNDHIMFDVFCRVVGGAIVNAQAQWEAIEKIGGNSKTRCQTLVYVDRHNGYATVRIYNPLNNNYSRVPVTHTLKVKAV